MKLANAKIDGQEVKVVFLNSTTQEQEKFLTNFFSTAYFTSDYLVLPKMGKLNDEIKEKMIDALKGETLVSNGQFLVGVNEVVARINRAESIAQFSAIYDDFKMIFTTKNK